MNARLTIRSKIFLSIFLILLVSYAILIHTTVRTIDGFLEKYLAGELNENLLYARDQYLARGNEIRVSLMHPASAPPVQERFERRDGAWLRDAGRRWHAILPHVELFTFVDPSLQVIARWGSPRSGDRFALAPVVERAYRERRPVVATELVTQGFLCQEGVQEGCRAPAGGDPKLMITVVVPLVKPDGRLVGAIVAGDIIDDDVMIPGRVQEIFGKQVVVAITRGGSRRRGAWGERSPILLLLLPRSRRSSGTGFRTTATPSSAAGATRPPSSRSPTAAGSMWAPSTSPSPGRISTASCGKISATSSLRP